MVSYYHQVYSHTHSHTVFSPTHTPMVSYYHQVYPLTALRELVLPLTLPWCRTTTKSSLTPTPILVLPLTPIYHVLTHSAPLTSFHLILATNASPMHHQPSPTLSHPSCLHRIIITSYHLSLPITTNRFLSLHTIHSTPSFHSQPSQSSPKSSPISIHTHSSPRRTP